MLFWPYFGTLPIYRLPSYQYDWEQVYTHIYAITRRYVFRIADGIMVNGDPKLLGVALNNLLRNAWKYTGKKEGTVIEFGATEIAGNQAYFVRDNGEGFDLADADKLFIPFQRLPGSEEFKGSGIDLAMVERIIRRRGGTPPSPSPHFLA